MSAKSKTAGFSPHNGLRARGEANKLLRRLWDRRDELFTKGATAEQVLLAAPEVVPRKLLNFDLVYVEEIAWGKSQFDIAGFIDRETREIVVAKRFPLEQRRFTTAHEIGHVVMHQGLIHHRDRPIDGRERLDRYRPAQEREADVFAAEFLMPSRLLTNVFYRYFGGRIVGSNPDDSLSSRLSTALERQIAPSDLREMSSLGRAKLIAAVSEFGEDIFGCSLAQRFTVSVTAMAIQLRDLGLVT